MDSGHRINRILTMRLNRKIYGSLSLVAWHVTEVKRKKERRDLLQFQHSGFMAIGSSKIRLNVLLFYRWPFHTE